MPTTLPLVRLLLALKRKEKKEHKWNHYKHWNGDFQFDNMALNVAGSIPGLSAMVKLNVAGMDEPFALTAMISSW